MVLPYSSQQRKKPAPFDMRHPASRGNVSQVPISEPSRTEKETILSQQRGSFLETDTNKASQRHLDTPRRKRKKNSFFFVGILLFVVLVYLSIQQGIATRDRVIRQGENGYESLVQAFASIRAERFSDAVKQFEEASKSFDEARREFSFWGGPLINSTRFIPGLSVLASGKHAIEVGKNIADAGTPLTILVERIAFSKDAYVQGEKISLLDLLYQAREPLSRARTFLDRAAWELERVSLNDIPESKREKFLVARTGLPLLVELLSGFEKHERLVEELLGNNGPRTYLFLLQNNHEMRATGGFIGSYAFLDINQGVVRRFFVDGIYNPDGQLKEKIIPPKPIQKISAAWSLHDSNWFPDFPTSAEKAIFFYEKTGGPTVDGVITLTPTVMQELLSVTGPIALPQYGLIVDENNFIPVVQEQVEVKYDKEVNEPKMILADLSRALFEKIFSLQDRATIQGIAEVLVGGLNEKHALLYMRHPETEQLIDEVGWSGRVLETPQDYLSVIHSNINGYKTDGVINETIRHRAEIEDDGSIIDTVTITRVHTGGDTPYEWWNKVNADYLRVYVPKGSELISSLGTTWEFPEAPLDYERLGFKKDAVIEREETNTVIDEKSGTRISEDAGKTVFGAWVYLSPKESVTVEFRYRLPFKILPSASRNGEVASYSMLFQKQSGSLGSTLVSELVYPERFKNIWQTEPSLIPYGQEFRRETTLKKDVFQGIVFESQ